MVLYNLKCKLYLRDELLLLNCTFNICDRLKLHSDRKFSVATIYIYRALRQIGGSSNATRLKQVSTQVEASFCSCYLGYFDEGYRSTPFSLALFRES